MANEAHKEPTMEEILASIRKIISDDEPKAPARRTPPPQPEAVATDIPDLDDDGFGFDEADADEVIFETGNDAFDEVPEPTAPPPASFEAVLGAVRAVAEPPQLPTQAPRSPEPIRSSRAPTPETEMNATQRYQQTVLTDDHTADAAAGSLGKLISKMELGGDNTIEGLVRELLKPMIKEWLDANLPQIVDEKVEAEVQRIARMAR